MAKMIRITSVVAALVLAPVLGASSGMLSSAQAQGFNIEVGPGGVRAVPPDAPRYDQRGPRMGCSERQARSAAREEGLRNAEVVRVTPRSVTVQGMTRRGAEQMRFANEPGCPTIG